MMNRHVLFCACGGFRITRADEKVGLAYLRRRLAETFDAHGDRGADDRASFDSTCATRTDWTRAWRRVRRVIF